MPTYQVDVGDKTYEVDAPDPNTAWQWANYTHAQPAPKTAGFSLKDLGISFGQGAVGSTEAITNVAGAGNAASQYLGDVNERLSKQYTPERQAELLRQQERMKKAEQSGSTLEELKAGVQNIAEAPLQSIAQGVGSFVPYIPAIFGGPVAAALGLSERAVVAANLVAKAYAPVVGTAQGAGSVKGAIYDAVYKAEKETGLSEPEARQKADAAQEYTGQNLDQIALGAGLGYIASKGGIEKYFTKEGREQAGQALLPRVGTAVSEEFLTEGAQGGQERLASNLALQRTGKDVPTFQGVAGQAFQEGLIGGLTAGPISAFTGGKSKADVEQERLKKEQDQFAEQEKAFVAQQAKTRENLQVPEMLALPPPSQRIEPVKEEKALTNPLGNITKDELGPEVSGYVEQHRQQNNLPQLQSYSIEDVRDAMTQVNPEGEKGALNSILTAKTGYSGEEKYAPQDVVNAAIEKNVAYETVGFQDYLQRTTGERDLNTMSQPQLYSAFKALSEMKRESGQQIVLPEGSNASRFTQDQYDKGRSFVTQQLATGEPLAASPAREALKDVTGLKTDRDVHTLLQTVIKNEDLNVAKVGDDFQITSSTPIKDARAPLPKGYSIEEGTYAEGERPAGFEITPEGRGKPLTTVDLEEEVAPKIERLTGLRQQEAAKMLADVNKYSGVVKAGQTSLDSMEARGLTGTEAYAKEKANQARREDILSKRIKTLMNRIEEMSAPLKSKPVGTKPIITKKSTLSKDGKVLGTFPSRLDAEASMLTQLTDAELDTLATDTRFGGITDRALQEQERRKAPPGMRVKGTEAGLAKAGVATKSTPEMAELEKKLVAALSKFGLKDVALKVVRAISNNAEGSYEAKLIKIAFDASNPVRTLRHEAVHALKELGFFTKDQWRVLENKAKNEWVQKYLAGKTAVVDGEQMSRLDAYKKMGLSESEILEEAISDAFADFDLNKAPPGMMMALLNKLRNFFKAIRQALTGAGFESAEDIFGKIEEGKLESQMDKADKAGSDLDKKQEKYALRSDRSNGSFAPNDKTISTRKPKSVNAPENYLTEKLNVGIGVVKEDPVLLKKHADLVRNDPMMGTFKSDSNEETLDHFIEALKDNLLHLWNSTPKKIRDRSRNWYKGANKIANNLADGADISERAASGVLAALSPQTPWDVNVSQAARVITIWKNHQNTVADSAMYDWFNSKIAILNKANIPSDAMIALRDAVKDQTFGQTHPDIQAWWLRAYDETHHSREYHLVAPEGESAGLMLKKNGEPANMPWGNTGNIDKALSILNDDSMSNISEQMGDAHKVRSFYNNIVEPDSKDEHVTIDTHAVAAARIEPLSGSAPEVLQAWGGKGSSDVHGQGGLYGEYAEAYRRAAQELGVLPREVQSVTWEKIRGFFPDTFKTEKATKHVKSIWEQYQQGTITAKQVREQITDYSPNENPNWHGVSKPSAEEAKSTPNEIEPTSGAVGSGQATKGKRGDTKLSLREAPNTPEFKRWFGKSKIVTSNGSPKVMYHGTSRDISAFRPKQANAIFVTEDPDFAGSFAFRSKDFMINEAAKELDNQKIKKIELLTTFVEEAIANNKLATEENSNGLYKKTREDYVNYFMEKPTSQILGTISIGKQLSDYLAESLKTGQNIMPVYVKAENPFDYKNNRHIKKVLENFAHIDEDIIESLKEGDWEVIESTDMQEAIQFAGFDGFYVKEHGIKNLAVYNSSQIKSATGNIGTYDAANPDIRYSLRDVKFKQTREAQRYGTGVDSEMSPEDLGTQFTYGGRLQVLLEHVGDLVNRAAMPSDPYQSGAGVGSGGVKYGLESMREKVGRALRDLGRTELPEYTNQIKRNAEYYVKEGKFKSSEKYISEANAWLKNYADAYKQIPVHTTLQELSRDAAVDLGRKDFVAAKRKLVQLEKMINSDQAEQHYEDVAPQKQEPKFSLRTVGEPATEENVLASMKMEQEKQSYMNCQLCVQMATGVPKLLDLPRVKKAQVGDVYTFNERKNMASHYAIDIGNGNIAEVEGWGEKVRTVPLQEVVDEYGEPDSILRPPSTAYTGKVEKPKFSLRDVKAEIESMPNGKQIFSAIKGATTTREEKGWAERITSFVAPRSFSQYRAQALDRYNQLSVYEKALAKENGGIERLADSNAHSASLMSDLHAGVTAQVLGVDDGVGGVPVFNKGYTSVSNLNGTVKGPMEIFKRLAAVGDPTIYQAYQFWAAAKRGKRLLGEGREQNIDTNGIGFAQALEDKYPMFVDIQKDWVKFNNGLVKYQIDTGVISKEMGQEWMKYADYIPFYRQLDGENTVGPKIYQSISGVKPSKKLKGSEAPLADFLETVVRNTHAAVQAGMKNVAAQRAGQLAVQVGIGERLDSPATGHDIITALENGKQVFYRIGDDLFVDAVTSLNIPELPFISFLTAPSNLLRNLVTKDPGFMLANLMRDSVSAYVTSGANIKPMIDTMQEFTRAARGNSPEFEMLRRAGVVGGYDYSKGVEASTKSFAKQLRKRSGTKTKSEKLLSPVTGIWDFLEKGSEISDAATRIAVFKDTLKRTGNEAEALLQSLEVMNFNRKGSSALIRIVTAGVPFLNARMQGLDVLYRAGIRPIFSGTNPTEREKQIQRTFFVRAGMIMGISLMYAMAVKDEPEYEAQEEETKDNNWLIPQLGIRIPTPFEIGFLFKTMPERVYRWAFSGSDTGEEFAASMKRGLVSTFAFNPVPQAVLPIAEAITNYSTFTMRPVVGQNLLNIDPQYQVGPSTSVMAEKVGEALGVSPMKIDHIYKGYTGTMGMYLVDTLDTVFDLFSDNPRPAKRFEQMPVLKRLLIDPEAKGNVTAYYAFKHSVDEAVRTVNFLDKRLNEDSVDYQDKKMGLIDYKQYISDMDQQMNSLQDESIMIRSSGMPAKEKRDALLDITRIQNEMLSDIRQIKKMAKEQ